MTPEEERFYKAGKTAQQIPYDPTLIHQFATRLYSNALTMQILITLAGALAGAALIFPLGPVGFVGCLIGLLIGYAIGAEYAFSLRLKAQIVLCQAEIELNTRRLLSSQERPAENSISETEPTPTQWPLPTSVPLKSVPVKPTSGMKVYGSKD